MATGINLIGLPFSGVEQVAEVLAATGIAVSHTGEIPLQRCSPHGAPRVVEEALTDLSASETNVLVYRNPWDSVHSALSSGEQWLIANPDMMRRAWQTFHQSLLGHLDGNNHEVVLVSYDAVASNPQSLIDLVVANSQFPARDTHLTELLMTTIDEPSIRGRLDPIGAIYGLLYADLLTTLDDLDSRALLPGPRATRHPEACPPHVLQGGTLDPGTGIQVILPCRNDGQFLAEAVASVAASTCEPVELTIVDDGSYDPETLRVMSLLRDAGFHVLRTSGVGLSAARNAATATSKTAAVIPLDSDNRLRPPLFEALGAITSGTADVVYGRVQYFGLAGSTYFPEPLTWSTILPHNPVDVCSLISRSLIERIGGWDPSVRMWEDWDFWMSALEMQAMFEVLPEIAFEYCVRPGSMLRTSGRDAQVRADAFRLIAAKHEAALKPVIFEAFIDVDQQRYDLLRSLSKTRVEAALLRDQQLQRMSQDERTG